MQTSKEVARALGVSQAAVSMAIARGALCSPVRRLGPYYIWSPEEVEAARRYFTNRKANRNA